MKACLKSTALIIMFSFVVSAAAAEKLPKGRQPEKADSLAREMLLAINDPAWQLTEAIQWNFMGRHEHLWDKKRQFSRVRWKKYEALIDINSVEGFVYKKGILVTGQKADDLVRKAWKLWINDSFWLNPISKVFDDGTTRSLVTLKNGQEGLMVSYSSGGNTPGDSYVWLLGENNLPYAWKMWVSVIPIGGIKIPWNGWIVTETGVRICNLHDTKIMDLKMLDVKTAFALEKLTGGMDVFDVLQDR